MDFSTVERRRDALRAELDLNHRTAPQIYLGVHAITRTVDGVELDGKGEVLDWALEMARFPDDALLARYAEDGRIDDTLLTGLAGQVVAMHVGAEVSDGVADIAGKAVPRIYGTVFQITPPCVNTSRLIYQVSSAAVQSGTVYDGGEFAAVMDKALKQADYAGFPARRAASEARGRLRGIGFGCYLEASGAGGAPKDMVSAHFRGDGLVHLYGVTGPSGQGHETSFAQIVSDGLGIPRELIRYHASDPATELMGNGTGGSRSLYGAPMRIWPSLCK